MGDKKTPETIATITAEILIKIATIEERIDQEIGHIKEIDPVIKAKDRIEIIDQEIRKIMILEGQIRKIEIEIIRAQEIVTDRILRNAIHPNPILRRIIGQNPTPIVQVTSETTQTEAVVKVEIMQRHLRIRSKTK